MVHGLSDITNITNIITHRPSAPRDCQHAVHAAVTHKLGAQLVLQKVLPHVTDARRRLELRHCLTERRSATRLSRTCMSECSLQPRPERDANVVSVPGLETPCATGPWHLHCPTPTPRPPQPGVATTACMHAHTTHERQPAVQRKHKRSKTCLRVALQRRSDTTQVRVTDTELLQVLVRQALHATERDATTAPQHATRPVKGDAPGTWSTLALVVPPPHPRRSHGVPKQHCCACVASSSWRQASCSSCEQRVGQPYHECHKQASHGRVSVARTRRGK